MYTALNPIIQYNETQTLSNKGENMFLRGGGTYSIFQRLAS